MVSLLKAWYGDAATQGQRVRVRLPAQAGRATRPGCRSSTRRCRARWRLMLSGMTATSIGPDSNQVLQALSNLKWLVRHGRLLHHQLGVLARARHRRDARCRPRCFMLPATHWIEKDGSFTNSGRWAQWKEQVLPPEGESRHDHWILAELFVRVAKLYRQQGGKFPDPVLQLTLRLRGPAQAGAGRDRPGDQRQGSDDGQAAGHVRRFEGRRHHDGRRLDLHRALPGERQPDEAAATASRTRPATTRPAWASTPTGPGAGR